MEHLLAPIIVTGCRRSGTTMLRTMLDQHPALCVHPEEPQFFQKLAHQFGNQINDPQAAIQTVLTNPYCPPSITAEALQAGLAGRTSLSVTEFIQMYVSVWGGPALRTRQAVFKDPKWILALDQVFEWFPNGKIIHIVRDPRANISSQRARWQKATVYECIVWWRDSVRAGHALALAKPDICYELVYENLITHPEETLMGLCKFFDIPFLPEMLTFQLDTPSFMPGAPPQRGHFTRPDPTRLNLWHKHLSPLDVRLIELACKDEMPWWGFEPAYPNASRFALAEKFVREKIWYHMLKIVRTLRARVQKI